MKVKLMLSPLVSASWGVVMAVMVVAAPLSHATILWTGPNTNWTKSVATPSDTVLAGKVVLTRGSRQVLYNTALGETALSPDALGSVSPAGTLWAFGTFDSHTAFQTMESMRNGNLAARILNVPMVMWITNDDIFVSFKFTTWGRFGSGTAAYTRSTPSVAPPTPIVSITNPPSGDVFAAPASVQIQVAAVASSGSVTNVAFLGNGVSLGSDQTAPFSITTGSLAAGAYALTAIATAAGVSATSSPVNITVVSPVDTTLSSQQITNNMFSFDYTANPGLRYVVENSSNLVNWLSLVTNTAAGSPVHYTGPSPPNDARYYRVGRLPNP
jgi:hypothetical protein